MILVFCPQGFANEQEFNGFAELRNFLLNVIGGAKKRVWLVTDYLSDGETVSSLYVAKYRKIDVAVLLGRAKARSYMSRLRYLQRQSIPVAIRPSTFPLKQPTLLLVDQKLYKIDGSLNFLEQRRVYSSLLGTTSELQGFQAAFLETRRRPIKTYAPPVPLVGKPRHNKTRLHKSQLANDKHGSSVKPSKTGSYNYDAHPGSVSSSLGMPTKLPKETKYQKLGKSGQDAEALLKEQKKKFRLRNVLNPITAKEPIIWSPRSPESF